MVVSCYVGDIRKVVFLFFETCPFQAFSCSVLLFMVLCAFSFAFWLLHTDRRYSLIPLGTFSLFLTVPFSYPDVKPQAHPSRVSALVVVAIKQQREETSPASTRVLNLANGIQRGTRVEAVFSLPSIIELLILVINVGFSLLCYFCLSLYTYLAHQCGSSQSNVTARRN